MHCRVVVELNNLVRLLYLVYELFTSPVTVPGSFILE